MTLAALVGQTEAWLQEELGAQRRMLALLARLEEAARAGAADGLERGGRELEAELAPAAAREARRRALIGRLAAALAVPANGITLSRLFARLEAEAHASHALASLRSELRDVVAAVVRAGRRLAAVARYHRGLVDEITAALAAGGTAQDGALVDARG